LETLREQVGEQHAADRAGWREAPMTATERGLQERVEAACSRPDDLEAVPDVEHAVRRSDGALDVVAFLHRADPAVERDPVVVELGLICRAVCAAWRCKLGRDGDR
jgi:hypothetical protein